MKKKLQDEAISLSLKIPKEDIPSAYNKMLNAKGTNVLTTLPVNPNMVKARFTFHPSFNKPKEQSLLFTDEETKVTISNFDKVSLLGNSVLFFLYCLCKFTAQVPSKKINKGIDYKLFREQMVNKENRSIYINFDEYLAFFDKDNDATGRKNAKRDLKEIYNTLKSITMDFSEFSYHKKKTIKYSLEVFSGRGEELSKFKNSGDIFFILNYDLVEYLTEKNFITYFPKKAFQIDTRRHPNALAITTKLSVTFSMNYLKTNHGLLSLKDLLESVLNLPSFEMVKSTDRHYMRRIIEPLEKDLEYLIDIGILEKWEYSNSKKQALKKEQLQEFNYKMLSGTYIMYEMADYPKEDQEERKKRLEKRKKD